MGVAVTTHKRKKRVGREELKGTLAVFEVAKVHIAVVKTIAP
jgi:hypothetical protein